MRCATGDRGAWVVLGGEQHLQPVGRIEQPSARPPGRVAVRELVAHAVAGLHPAHRRDVHGGLRVAVRVGGDELEPERDVADAAQSVAELAAYSVAVALDVEAGLKGHRSRAVQHQVARADARGPAG